MCLSSLLTIVTEVYIEASSSKVVWTIEDLKYLLLNNLSRSVHLFAKRDLVSRLMCKFQVEAKGVLKSMMCVQA